MDKDGHAIGDYRYDGAVSMFKEKMGDCQKVWRAPGEGFVDLTEVVRPWYSPAGHVAGPGCPL